MKFAKVVFAIAGGLGIPAAINLYFAPGNTMYYGLLAAVVAWQPAFLIIAWDPQRYRPMMIPSVMEKMIWVATFLFFYSRGQVTPTELAGAIIPHGTLGILFVIAYFRTSPRPT